MSPIRERVQRWPRAWRIAAATALALYLLYLLAGNLFLNTPLFDAVTNRKPEKFQLRTGPALTLVPGHAVVWNIHIRGQANRTVYILRAERASARISLPALFRREVRIPRIDATDVRAIVTRVETAIEPPPRSDRGWTLRFDAIHSDSIRSGVFGKLVVAGKGSGTVGFLKQMRGGPSELFDSTARFEQAIVRMDGMTVLDDARLDASASYPRHFRDQAPGLRKFGIVKAHLKVDARSQILRIDTSGARVKTTTAPSAARMQADMAMDRGALQPGSHLAWRMPLHAGVAAPDRGLLALQLDVADDIRIQARLPRDPATGSELQADVRVAGRDVPFHAMASLLPRLSGQVRGSWKFASLNWIADLFVRKPWFRLHGGGLVQADLRLADGRLAPGSRMDIPQVTAVAEVAGVRMQGEASATGRITDADTPQAELEVAIPRFRAAPVGEPKQVLFDGRAMALALRGDARLEKLRDGMRAYLRFNDARVPDLARYNRYLANDQLRLLGGTGLLSGDVELDTSGRIGSGRADLRGQQARLQVAGVALAGNARLKTQLQRADFEARQFDLTGTTLRLQDIRVDDDQDSRGWWGEVAVRQGHISAAAPFQVDALASLRLRDAAPLLAIFAQHSDRPRWVLGLVDSGQVDASGQLRWRQGQLVVDDLQAENQRLSLRGRLDLAHTGRRGDLYLRWGILGAGIELDGEQRQWHLSGAREWYEQRPRLLPPLR